MLFFSDAVFVLLMLVNPNNRLQIRILLILSFIRGLLPPIILLARILLQILHIILSPIIQRLIQVHCVGFGTFARKSVVVVLIEFGIVDTCTVGIAACVVLG